VWQPPVECSRLEREVIKRIKRDKLFVWLCEHRHELFDEDLQASLTGSKRRPVRRWGRVGLPTTTALFARRQQGCSRSVLWARQVSNL
jgi:hypothetical protein